MQDAALAEKLAQRVFFSPVLAPRQQHRGRNVQPLALPGQAPAQEPGQNAAGLSVQCVSQRPIFLAFIWGRWVVHKADVEDDGAEPIPESRILRVGVWLVVGEQDQQVRGREAVVAPVELAGGNIAAAREELHLPDIKARTFAGLAGPHDAFALQGAQVWFGAARREEFTVTGKNDIIGHRSDGTA